MRFKQALALALVVLLAAPAAVPAAPLAILNGTVTSVTGRPVAMVDLELVSLDNGRVARVQTDAAGGFRAGLEPGLYTVTPSRHAYVVVRGPRVVSLAAGTAVSAELAVSGVQDPAAPGQDRDRDKDPAGVLLPSSSAGKAGLSAADITAISVFSGALVFAAVKAATFKNSPKR